MKKLLIVAVVAATSTVASAFDYKINLEGRADFVNSNVKTTTTAGVLTTEKYNNFSNSLVRLNVLGAINDNLTYRLRYRLISTSANPATTNTSNPTLREINSQGLDYLYVDHKNQFFTTRFGKQNWVEAYGREEFVSGTDVFLTSQAATNFRAGFGSDYRYGVTAMFKFMDTNNFSLAVSNPNTTVTDTTGNRKNTSLAYGAHYNGSFLNKMIQPVLAYSIAGQDGDTDAAVATRTKKGNNTIWAAGWRTEAVGMIFDADYKMFKKANRNDGTNVSAVQEKTKSIYANVAFPVGDFTPLLTYINDKFDSEINAGDFKRNSFAVGTYWKPMADVNFRYHLMFTSAQTKADGATSTVSKVDDKKIYFGFKADI